MRCASCSRCWCFSRATTSSRVACRTTCCGRIVAADACGRRAPGSPASRCRPPVLRRSGRRRRRQAQARVPAESAGCAVALGSSARSGSRNVCVRPTGVNLTLTNGRAGLGAHEASSIRHEPGMRDIAGVGTSPSDASTLQLKRQPVRDDLRAGVALERRQRAIDRRKRARRARSPSNDRAQPLSSGFRSALASARSSARRKQITPRSRSSDASARRRRASSSRSPAAAPASACALSSRRRGSLEVAARAASSSAAASRASTSVVRPALERRPTLPSAATRPRARRSAAYSCARISTAATSPARAGRSAAADSAIGPSAAARRAAT